MKFVLVHGAWSGGWGWKRVAERLRAAGHTVFVPTLTGLGERSHLYSPAVNLETHVQDVLGVIENEELQDFVLCGHSYGGMVVTPAADRVHDRLRALVYLDAFLPKNGQSLLDLVPGEVRGAYEKEAAANNGRVPPQQNAVQRGITDADDIAWVDRHRMPHPFATLNQGARLTGNNDRIKTRMYILCSEFKPSPFHKFAAETRNAPGWLSREIPCHHLPNISMPDDVVKLLIEAGNEGAKAAAAKAPAHA
jgi:pimeloyl-ACP methyl ester carboxylesterase